MALADLRRLERNEEGIAAAIVALAQRFGEFFQKGQDIRAQHAHTTTYIPAQLPDGVVFAQSAEEVQDVVRICGQHRVPVIAFGTGTSLEGHVNAPAGGISPRPVAHEPRPRGQRRRSRLHGRAGRHARGTQHASARHGLFFPIDPGANASLGGMASTRASGTNAVRYGTMRDNVLSLQAVMADGRMISTGRRARKSSAGYDLTRLLVGAEGTLGIITSLTLKLHGIPDAISGGVCPFETVDAACRRSS